METHMRYWSGAVLDLWQTATPADFGALMLGVIVFGWFIGRYFRN